MPLPDFIYLTGPSCRPAAAQKYPSDSHAETAMQHALSARSFTVPSAPDQSWPPAENERRL